MIFRECLFRVVLFSNAFETGCDDGEKCTADDWCVKGECVSGEWDFSMQGCQCNNQQDCLKFENGNVCDGTLYCDLSDHSCVLNPATVLSCPNVDDTACSINTCDPLSGGCAMKPMPEGQGCDDANKCTVPDECHSGVCVSGEWDYSLEGCECGKDADCASHEDDDECTGE